MILLKWQYAGMAELADAADSKSSKTGFDIYLNSSK
jgi:hypothetical protein